jgi:hypothetical protein
MDKILNMEKEFLIGAGIGIGMCKAWDVMPGHEQFAMSAKRMTSATGEPEKSPLAFLEHYHCGIASAILGKSMPKYAPYLYGFGAAMIGSELFQDHPFGIGKTPEEIRGNLAMVIMLGSLLGVSML